MPDTTKAKIPWRQDPKLYRQTAVADAVVKGLQESPWDWSKVLHQEPFDPPRRVDERHRPPIFR